MRQGRLLDDKAACKDWNILLHHPILEEGMALQRLPQQDDAEHGEDLDNIIYTDQEVKHQNSMKHHPKIPCDPIMGDLTQHCQSIHDNSEHKADVVLEDHINCSSWRKR